jgi:hypothetical protein
MVHYRTKRICSIDDFGQGYPRTHHAFLPSIFQFSLSGNTLFLPHMTTISFCTHVSVSNIRDICSHVRSIGWIPFAEDFRTIGQPRNARANRLISCAGLRHWPHWLFVIIASSSCWTRLPLISPEGQRTLLLQLIYPLLVAPRRLD